MGALRPFLSRASSAVGSLPLAPCFPCYPHPSNTRGAWQTLGLGAFRAPGLSFSSSCSSLRAATARQMAGPHLLPAFSSLKAFRGSARAYSSWSMMRGGGDAETAVYGLMASNCIVYLLWHLPVLSKEFMYANFTLTSSDVRWMPPFPLTPFALPLSLPCSLFIECKT